MARHPWLEKNLRDTLAFAERLFLAEDIAAQKGFLQSLDPRVKTATLLGFVVAALFTKDLAVLGAFYFLSLALAASSAIPLWFFLKRTWVFIPLFSLGIALPAAFSFATPGPALFRLGPAVVTLPGLLGAALFVFRVAVSVSYAVLLSATTRHSGLLKTLRIFGLPALFVMVLGMAWRYVGLFVESLETTLRAVKSRVGRMSGGHGLAAWNLASLWTRSFQMNERVYDAMRSRGYAGEVVLLHSFKTRARDWVWIGAALLFLGISLFL